ncbi:MAG: NAD-dependent epimerase/dehydratase family protein, partial [Hymenobacter sp.]
MNNHKILVAGATGLQGGAVVEALLAKGISIRAIVRNKNSEAAQALAARGVELTEGTFDDTDSLAIAARGVTGVF